MSETDDGPDDGELGADDVNPALDEVRQAAGAVVASLKWLIDATERVIEDPEAFARVVDSGRGVVEAFTSGFIGGHEEGFPPDDGQGASAPDDGVDGPADS